MEDKAISVSQMMANERASKRKSTRDIIVARERLLRMILRSITKPRSSVSTMVKRITMLVNAMIPITYKL
jgi:hypothetical protein